MTRISEKRQEKLQEELPKKEEQEFEQRKSALTATREILGIIKNVIIIIFVIMLIVGSVSIYFSFKSGKLFQNLSFGQEGKDSGSMNQQNLGPQPPMDPEIPQNEDIEISNEKLLDK